MTKRTDKIALHTTYGALDGATATAANAAILAAGELPVDVTGLEGQMVLARAAERAGRAWGFTADDEYGTAAAVR